MKSRFSQSNNDLKVNERCLACVVNVLSFGFSLPLFLFTNFEKTARVRLKFNMKERIRHEIICRMTERTRTRKEDTIE